MKQKIHIASLLISMSGIACTSQPEKPCLCEAVAVQPTCPQPSQVAQVETKTVESESPTQQDVGSLVEADLGASTESSEALSQKPLPESNTVIEESDLAEENSNREYVVVGSGLNVRSGPSMESPIVGSLKAGDTVKMLSREGVWVMISQDQYVSIKHLQDK
jgi:uncharacterized protein YgiM (DUF1202 family)